MSNSNPKFDKTELSLKNGHLWTAADGFSVAALDRGAIRFEFPQDWICIPDEDSVKFYDHEPPSDNCRLAVSRQQLPDVADEFGLDRIVNSVATDDPRGLLSTGAGLHLKRGSLDVAWTEFEFTDPVMNRKACTRFCFARGSGLYALITFEFWQNDRDRFAPIWDHVMNTLAIGEFILDPTLGARVQRNDPKAG